MSRKTQKPKNKRKKTTQDLQSEDQKGPHVYFKSFLFGKNSEHSNGEWYITINTNHGKFEAFGGNEISQSTIDKIVSTMKDSITKTIINILKEDGEFKEED